MPRGDKSKYAGKQERKADHIVESYESRGVPEKEAERIAWATVNKESGGGKKSGSGRGQPESRLVAKGRSSCCSLAHCRVGPTVQRIRHCCHEFGELRVNLVPGAIDKRLHGRLWDTTLRQRSVMLAAVAVDEQRAEFVLIRCDIPNPVEASPFQCRVRAHPGIK